MAVVARLFDGKKYVWDGKKYDSEEEAKAVEKEYLANDFEVQSCCEDDKILLFTRRVVTEVVITD